MMIVVIRKKESLMPRFPEETEDSNVEPSGTLSESIKPKIASTMSNLSDESIKSTIAPMINVVYELVSPFEFIFYSLQILDLSATHAIINATPVVVTVLSVIFLDEKATCNMVVACGLFLVGIGCMFGRSVYQTYFSGSNDEVTKLIYRKSCFMIGRNYRWKKNAECFSFAV